MFENALPPSSVASQSQGPPLPPSRPLGPPQANMPGKPATPPMEQEHVTVMPQKFYVPPKNPTPWKKILLGLGIVIVVGGSIIAAAWYATGRLQSSEPPPLSSATSMVKPPETKTPESADVPTNDASVVTIPPSSSPDNEFVPPASPDQIIEPGEAPSTPATPLEKGEDSDGDGLTTVEEQLYGTDIAQADTDGDKYADGRELMNLYSPNDPNAGRRLWESAVVNKYEHPQGTYQLLYPAGWTARSTDAQSREVLLTSSTGEFVDIVVEENTNALTPIEWYHTQAPEVQKAQLESITTRSGWQGVKSPDRSTVYLAIPGAPSLIVVAHYNTGVRSTASFWSTFSMIIESLQQRSAQWPFAAPSQAQSSAR